MKHLSSVLIFLVLGMVHGEAQDAFRFKRDIASVRGEGWYNLSLPPEIFQHLNGDLGDIRLYSFSGDDTLELPYVLRIRHDEVTGDTISLKLFNKSYHQDILYLTFELDTARDVNVLDLHFANGNYFGYVTIEGSDDRKQWFDIAEDQRIVSIQRSGFRISAVRFPMSRYRFLRVSVKSDTPLNFTGASFAYRKIKPGVFHNVPLAWEMSSDKNDQISYVGIKFGHYLPVGRLNVQIDDGIDYYRSFSIAYLRDSTRTDKGWIRNYHRFFEGHLTSFKANAFDFPTVFTKELRLVVKDLDDRPLSVRSISAAGPEVALTTYLKPGNNFMLYGAGTVRQPMYDLAYFKEKLPGELPSATLTEEEEIPRANVVNTPLFGNKIWLWSIMVLMIGGLGFFTMKMMRTRQ